jgi:esterase/lipase superfamily enzyme
MHYIANVRKDGVSANGNPLAFAQLSTAPNGFAGPAGQPLTLGSLATAVTGRRVVVLIHGYNTDFGPTARALDQVVTLLSTRNLADDFVAFFWPGGSNPLTYMEARNRVDAVAGRLIPVLEALAATAAFVDVNAHSLGCRVALRALCGNDGARVRIRDLVMLAAAVPDVALDGPTRFPIRGFARSMLVFYSGEDQVLRRAYPAGEFLSTWDRFPRALGVHGPADFRKRRSSIPFVQAIDCAVVVPGDNDHSQHRNSPDVWNHIAVEASRGNRPFARPQWLRLIPGGFTPLT